MKYPQKIDLHMHSNVSDGTDTPLEILANVKTAGIDLFSVTDHDAVKGCRIICGALQQNDPRFITGAEFSCKDEEGKYHILGYGYDPDADAIQKLVDLGHSYRMNKLRGRLDFLRSEFQVEFPQEELARLYALDNPGKPHIGNLMVKYGYAKTKEQAICEFINKLHYHSQYLRPEEAIAGILGAGGIPVLAHPTYGSGDQLIMGSDMDRRLRRLMVFGLMGVEAFYSGFTEKIRREMLSFAEQYGLYVSAGSDYHGQNKMIELGDTGLSRTVNVPKGLQRFLEDVSYIN